MRALSCCVFVASIVAISCGEKNQIVPASSASVASAPRLGAAVRDSGAHWCATFDNAYPDYLAKDGDTVTVVWVDSTVSPASASGRVRNVRRGLCRSVDSAHNEDAARQGALAYEFVIDDPVDTIGVSGIAHVVLGRSVWGIGAFGWAYGDIDHDGRDEIARVCASSEGLHFTLFRQLGDGKRQRIAHYYHYLGYDTDPSCTEEEYTG